MRDRNGPEEFYVFPTWDIMSFPQTEPERDSVFIPRQVSEVRVDLYAGLCVQRAREDAIRFVQI